MEQKQEEAEREEEERKDHKEVDTRSNDGTSALLEDSPLAFIPPLDSSLASPKRGRSRRTTLEKAIDAVNEMKEKDKDSAEYHSRRATLEKQLEAVTEAARKAAIQAAEMHQKKSSIIVKKVDLPPQSTPRPVKLLKQPTSIPLYKVKIQLTREQKWERFLQLPMKSAIPNGNVAHDLSGLLRRGQWQSAVYITLRQFQFESFVPHHVNPQFCLIINPESKLTHACFPIMDMGKCCDEQYPKIVEMLYETFLEFDIHEETRYRPAMIMVDDPLLAVCLRRELEGYDDTVGQTNTTGMCATPS